ncbi:hypothetical protein E6O75_ATG09480 [Venturia nashicola]|uniref:Uncharacterized protein n=1 Tax=Venturia nashicola TaxID=86259 RepID=A0A4Z1NGE3_9PEZI|nr:hypothetical protein E6O75_ATG09480 [Venturia nashicola]
MASAQSTFGAQRAFSQTARRFAGEPAAVLPARRPVGAFRGGLLGFLSGSVLAAGSMYFYVLQEYRVSNELLTEDIYHLQATVQRIEGYVRVLEDKVDSKKK